jgi:hypothetical protein
MWWVIEAENSQLEERNVCERDAAEALFLGVSFRSALFIYLWSGILVLPRSTSMSLSFDAFRTSNTALSSGLHLIYNEVGNKHVFETFDVLCS